MLFRSQHWSKRTLLGHNETLWAGWVLLGDDFRVYFAGDSGYVRHFAEIGERFGPFDLSLIPIGAYEPRWFMHSMHIGPHEAVQIHRDLGSKLSVAMHWGTFALTDEPFEEPPQLLRDTLQAQNLTEKDFWIMGHGETRWLDEVWG